jgi:membrane associated rhomboid family serine protease
MGFGPPVTPDIIKYLLIANIGVYLASYMVPGLFAYGALTPALFWQGGYLWQPFTYMWLHSQASLLHIVMNMFVLWMFGSQLAMAWGARRFLRYYLICGVGAGFIIATGPYLLYALGMASPINLAIPTVGASGAIYGVMLAYSLTWPERTIMLIFPPVAFRAIWLIPLLFLMALLFPGGNISHIGHLGGVLVGWLYLRRRGPTRGVLSVRDLRSRWHRYRMRQKLRAIRYEEHARRRRHHDDDERRLH